MKHCALIDERLVEDTLHLRRSLGRPVLARTAPVIDRGVAYGVTLRDAAGLWRMYYTTWVTRDLSADRVGLDIPLLLAYSHDGIAWDRPDFGIVTAPGYAQLPNAIIGPKQRDANGRYLSGWGAVGGAVCVIDAETHPHPCARARFTALVTSYPIDAVGGMFIAFSDDGVRWDLAPEGPFISGGMDSFNSLLYDPALGRYVSYLRPPVHCGMDVHANRKMARCESEDLLHWTLPEIVLDTDERDAPGLDVFDEPGMPAARGRTKQFQGMAPCILNGCYLALAWYFDAVAGDYAPELIHSADGIHWQREALREPFIAAGRPDGFAGCMITPGGGEPVLVGDDYHLYVSATPYNHHQIAIAENLGIGENRQAILESDAIYLLTLKRDRWIAYEAGDHAGELLSKAFDWGFGGKLTLNCAIEPDGYLQLDVTDRLGRKIADYHLDEIPALTGPCDAVDRPVTFGPDWSPKTLIKLPQLGPIRLRFRMKRAKLYGWSLLD